jgi:hypothetical protein
VKIRKEGGLRGPLHVQNLGSMSTHDSGRPDQPGQRPRRLVLRKIQQPGATPPARRVIQRPLPSVAVPPAPARAATLPAAQANGPRVTVRPPSMPARAGSTLAPPAMHPHPAYEPPPPMPEKAPEVVPLARPALSVAPVVATVPPPAAPLPPQASGRTTPARMQLQGRRRRPVLAAAIGGLAVALLTAGVVVGERIASQSSPSAIVAHPDALGAMPAPAAPHEPTPTASGTPLERLAPVDTQPPGTSPIQQPPAEGATSNATGTPAKTGTSWPLATAKGGPPKPSSAASSAVGPSASPPLTAAAVPDPSASAAVPSAAALIPEIPSSAPVVDPLVKAVREDIEEEEAQRKGRK